MGHTVLVSWKTKNIEKKSVWGSSKIRMMKYRKSINRKASWPAVNIACAPGSMKDHWCLSPKQFLDFRGLIFHWVTAVSCRVAASVDVCPKFFSHDFPVKFAFIALLFFFFSHFCSQLCEAVCRDLNSEHSRLLGDVFFSFCKQSQSVLVSVWESQW